MRRRGGRYDNVWGSNNVAAGWLVGWLTHCSPASQLASSGAVYDNNNIIIN